METQGRKGSGSPSAGDAAALLAALIKTGPAPLANKALRDITWGDVEQWAPRPTSTGPRPKPARRRTIHLPAAAEQRLHELEHRPNRRRPLFAAPLNDASVPVEEVRRSLTER
ncbi:hypothetical protein ACQEVX_05200 [Streptomyces syringium]|uniref:hypothetical protein n=1 Tax=Streptomyces syringium TaxID=76729 RepID=UPI003D8CB38A